MVLKRLFCSAYLCEHRNIFKVCLSIFQHYEIKGQIFIYPLQINSLGPLRLTFRMTFKFQMLITITKMLIRYSQSVIKHFKQKLCSIQLKHVSKSMIHLVKGIPKVELLDSASIHFTTLLKFISSFAY